jgi:prophage regulatory protein
MRKHLLSTAAISPLFRSDRPNDPDGVTSSPGKGVEKLSEIDDRLIGDPECGRLSGLSRTTRWRLERKGKFPARRQISENRIGWLLSEVLEWRRNLTSPTRMTAPT